MFAYLRYFFGITLIVILALAAIFGWNYRQSSFDLIIKQIQLSNTSFSKNYYNSVWQAGSGIGYEGRPLTWEGAMKTYFYNLPAEQRVQWKEFEEFNKKTRGIMKDLNIVRLNVYIPSGDVLYSTSPTSSITLPKDAKYDIYGYNDKKMSPLATLSSGGTSSELIHNASFATADGTRVQGSLVRTIIPLRYSQSDGSGNADLVLEIFTDVSDSVKQLDKWQYIGVAVVLGILVILFISLTISSRRAEKIIERQHETNVELAGAKAAAETQNQQKSQFLASISHELRTPLNAIIGFSEIIKDEVMGELNNEQYKNYIKDIHSSGVHLLSLINDILDYSKAEAGKLDMEYEDIDLTKLIASSLRLQEPRAKSAEVELVRDLPNDHIIIRSDSKRLKQIMLNLLSNAVKFTPAGGSVKVSAWLDMQNQDQMFIEVKDTGIGIAPKDIAKALSPFGQVDSELSRRYEGTGLGLPLTKKFVELLGGSLRLDSEVNKGTTITIALPINADPNGMKPKATGMTALES